MTPGMLSDAAVAGNLSVRADITRHNGDFGKVIEGVNNTLDAITVPLNTAADYHRRYKPWEYTRSGKR